MRIFTADTLPHALVEHVLNANIFLFAFVLLQSKGYNHQTIENDPNGNRCVKHFAMYDIIDRKGSDDQCSNDKLDNAENNAVEKVMGFDSVIICSFSRFLYHNSLLNALSRIDGSSVRERDWYALSLYYALSLAELKCK